MKGMVNDLLCAAWMASIFIGFLLHGCGMYGALVADVAIGTACLIAGIKKESRR